MTPEQERKLDRALDAMAETNTKLAVHVANHQALAETVESLGTTVWGEADSPGLKGRVDRLEQSEEKRTWVLRTLAGTWIASAAAGVAAWFHAGK